jgi:hypothetical protein
MAERYSQFRLIDHKHTNNLSNPQKTMSKFHDMNLMNRTVYLGLIAVACGFLPACKKEQEPTLVPVSGKVTVGGTVLPLANVSFYPDAAKGNTSTKVPTARVQEDGSYKLMTTTSGGPKQEGAPPGWYKVVVTRVEPGTPELQKLKIEAFNPDYQSERKTKLSFEVKEGAGAVVYDIKLPKMQ